MTHQFLIDPVTNGFLIQVALATGTTEWPTMKPVVQRLLELRPSKTATEDDIEMFDLALDEAEAAWEAGV